MQAGDKLIIVTNERDAKSSSFKTGAEVNVYTYSDWVSWKITDKDGKDVSDQLQVFKGDINSREFSFYMPAYDLQIDAVFQHKLDEQEKIDNCTCLCHSDNQIVQFFWKIIKTVMDLIEQLTGKEILCECGY